MKLLHLDSSIMGEGSASRAISAAVVARLHADPTFMADLAAARAELAAVRAKGLAPSRDCAKETAQLAAG